jgi:hypothetical protein
MDEYYAKLASLFTTWFKLLQSNWEHECKEEIKNKAQGYKGCGELSYQPEPL